MGEKQKEFLTMSKTDADKQDPAVSGCDLAGHDVDIDLQIKIAKEIMDEHDEGLHKLAMR